MAFGDSKTATGTWPATLQANLAPVIGEPALVYKLAVPGSTVAYWRTQIDASLAGALEIPKNVVCDLGVNDVLLWPLVEATWKSDYGYILDAFHTKWPSAHVYVTLPWARNNDSDSHFNDLATWITDIVSTRSAWASVGPDQRVWVKGADNGATNTIDGVHFSVAGNLACAAQWQTALGY